LELGKVKYIYIDRRLLEKCDEKLFCFVLLFLWIYGFYYNVEFECVFLMSRMGCYVLSILLSSPSRTVIL
jgi:hypothetical protein